MHDEAALAHERAATLFLLAGKRWAAAREQDLALRAAERANRERQALEGAH